MKAFTHCFRFYDMRPSRALLLGFTTLACFINVFADVSEITSGASPDNGYHYEKSSSNDNSDQGLEIKAKGSATAGDTNSQSSSYYSGSLAAEVPAIPESISPQVIIHSNVVLPTTGPGLIAIENNAQGESTPDSELINQEQEAKHYVSSGSGTQGGTQYWWMAAGSPFKPQGGCNANGCQISGTFTSESAGGGAIGGITSGSNLVGGSSLSNTAASGSYIHAGNPFLGGSTIAPPVISSTTSSNFGFVNTANTGPAVHPGNPFLGGHYAGSVSGTNSFNNGASTTSGASASAGTSGLSGTAVHPGNPFLNTVHGGHGSISGHFQFGGHGFGGGNSGHLGGFGFGGASQTGAQGG